ncbi:5'-nucleosidase [Opitutaceae bacterium EW11]|nr:5'-nucleosidase [Opitutaceae bacterium EW11]
MNLRLSVVLARAAWLSVAVLVLCGPVRAAEKLIALCGAYPPEMEALKKGFGATAGNGFERTVVRGVEFWRGSYAGKQVVIFRTGMSLVNASYQLQLALDHFPITHVLFAGVAGGVDPSLHVGDVVIPERWAYHGEAAYLNDDGKGGFNKPDYFTVRYKNFGMIFPEEVGAIRPDGVEQEHVPAFPVDPGLLETARKIVPALPAIRKGGRAVQVLVGGTGVAGTVFLDNAAYREWIYAVWKARCVDMESTALAQVAYANGKPILIVRGLSDLAGGQAGPNPISSNESPVSDIAVQVLRKIVEAL